MIRILVVCEGQTEETFIREVIAPVLAYSEIFLEARLISTSKTGKGGALSYERVKRFILNSLKEDKHTVITTFFDLYALNNGFPDFVDAQKQSDVYIKVTQLEHAFKEDIVKENSLFASRFLPYIQPYEFEALLFSDIEKLIEIETPWSKASKDLQAIRDSVPTPEHINDGYETKPSTRIGNCLRNPKYRKTLHGSLAIQAIGIDKLLAECQHFNEWYGRLIGSNKKES